MLTNRVGRECEEMSSETSCNIWSEESIRIEFFDNRLVFRKFRSKI